MWQRRTGITGKKPHATVSLKRKRSRTLDKHRTQLCDKLLQLQKINGTKYFLSTSFIAETETIKYYVDVPYILNVFGLRIDIHTIINHSNVIIIHIT